MTTVKELRLWLEGKADEDIVMEYDRAYDTKCFEFDISYLTTESPSSEKLPPIPNENILRKLGKLEALHGIRRSNV